MIPTLLVLLVSLLAISVYSLLLLAVCVPRAFNNGRLQGHLEQELRRQERSRQAHPSNVTRLPLQRHGGRL